MFEARNNAIIHLFLNCGLRLSEFTNLKISDFNFKENTFVVLGKGNKERMCYLNKITQDVLQNYISLRENSKVKEDIKNSKWLFISYRSKQITKRQIDKIVKKAYRESEIDEKEYCVHTLRYSFATILYKSGVDIRMLQILLDHSRIETTQI